MAFGKIKDDNLLLINKLVLLCNKELQTLEKKIKNFKVSNAVGEGDPRAHKVAAWPLKEKLLINLKQEINKILDKNIARYARIHSQFPGRGK